MSRSNGDENRLVETLDPGGQTKECERFGLGSWTNRQASCLHLFAPGRRSILSPSRMRW